MAIQQNIIKKSTQTSFLLSLLLHFSLLLFLLISTSVILTPREQYKKSPEMYIPSYTYHGAVTPPPVPQQTTVKTPESSQQNIQTPQSKPSPLASSPKTVAVKKVEKSILAMSRNMIQQKQITSAISNMQNSEPPILLVGDKHSIVDPLIKLMGRALSAHFTYPRIEGTFGVRGRVLVELVLHPEGYFSDVQIIESSDNEDFDAAALYAVNTAPKAVGVDKFLPKPKRFVVGFLFD